MKEIIALVSLICLLIGIGTMYFLSFMYFLQTKSTAEALIWATILMILGFCGTVAFFNKRG